MNAKGIGYSINETNKVVVQAYADDLVLFSNTREGMNENLAILDSFMKYSKLEVNADKCHSVSYVYRNGTRVYEEEPFMINDKPVPVSTLAYSVEYLGVDATTTHQIRVQGSTAVIEGAIDLIKKIEASDLALNQKIFAIRTFAIPRS